MMAENRVNVTENLAGKLLNSFPQVVIVSADNFVYTVLIKGIYVNLLAADHIEMAGIGLQEVVGNADSLPGVQGKFLLDLS